VASSAGGKVTEVNFHIGDDVEKGVVLFRLDTEKLDHQIAQKKGSIAAKKEELARLETLRGLLVEEHRAAVDKAKAELRKMEADLAHEIRMAKLEQERAREEEVRLKPLVEEGIVARAEYDKAVQRRKEAEERCEVAQGRTSDPLRRNMELLEKEYARRHEENQIQRAQREADFAAEERSLAKLEKEVEGCVVRAHVSGTVVVGELNVGDIVEPGKAVLAIAQNRGFRIDIAVPSSEMAGLEPGMTARIKLDAFDYQKYGTATGKILSISPDSQMKDQQVFYVVKILIEGREVGRDKLRGPIKLGMTGQVEIVTGEERMLSVLLKKIQRAVSVS